MYNKEQKKQYYEANKEKILERQKKYDKTRKRTYTSEQRTNKILVARKYRHEARLEAISHYSNGENKCSCCGENNEEFLTLDHPDGGGSKERREKGKGYCTAEALRARGYIDERRVLCANCNTSFGHYGYCPHDK